ncbi:MAG: M14 family metallopeptidase [Pirellulaceae bacterium]
MFDRITFKLRRALQAAVVSCVGPIWVAAGSVLLLPCAASAVAEPLEYYLPEGVEYDEAIPTPSDIIGHDVGEWHVTHDRLVHYMRTLAECSERITLTETGRTYEGRPLLLLTISSASNLRRIDDIRKRHLALSDPRRPLKVTKDMPLVTWLGYSVHGNEPSGGNASMVMAYHLAAATDEWMRRLLDESVILLDPVLNPDGFNRFANWVNAHRGRVLAADRQSREHNEAWPNSRTNHYWFDLNRDWLLLVHPESRARVGEFQRWRPNVQTDHHEMSADRTYFFQPGVSSRRHPMIPRRNQKLTLQLGRYHAEALDEVGQAYFTRERFDDFNLGKGSTYPDVHGAVGILFEQASSRGHLHESKHGELAFPVTIRNQVLTSFSTLRAALDMRSDLLQYQREFYETAYQEGGEDPVRGWIVGDDGDPARARDFIGALLQHGIEVHLLRRNIKVGGHAYRKGSAWVVPTEQPQYRLARGIFETRTEFEDTTFYDVSAWTLPLAYGLPHAELHGHFSQRVLGDRLESLPNAPEPVAPNGEPALAYLFDWGTYYAPRALHRLLQAEVVVRAASEPFTLKTHDGRQQFGRGAVVVPMGIQQLETDRVIELLDEAAREDGVRVRAAVTGLAEAGVDIGSPSLKAIEQPRVALVVGPGVHAYEAGEVWHLLDQRFHMPVTLLDVRGFSGHDLSRYTHVVLVDGSYGKDMAGKIRNWVRSGGVLLVGKRAASWAAEHEIVKAEFKTGIDITEGDKRRDYADYRTDRELQQLSGAILMADLDTTHPLGWGVNRRELPVFCNGTRVMQPAENRYQTVAQLVKHPLRSGYASPENLKRLSESASVIVQRNGKGTVVLMAHNLNFRGYWFGTNRVFMNAIMFGGIVERTGE